METDPRAAESVSEEKWTIATLSRGPVGVRTMARPGLELATSDCEINEAIPSYQRRAPHDDHPARRLLC